MTSSGNLPWLSGNARSDLGRHPEGALQDIAGPLNDPTHMAGLYAAAAADRRESLASGRSGARHPNEVCEWLAKGASGDFEDTATLAVWAAENARAGQWPKETRRGISAALFDVGQLVLLISDRASKATMDYQPASRSGCPSRVFRPGSLERDRAHEEIGKFLSGLTSDLIVDDPYFTPADLHILRFVPRGLRVIVVTSTKVHRGISDQKKSDYWPANRVLSGGLATNVR